MMSETGSFAGEEVRGLRDVGALLLELDAVFALGIEQAYGNARGPPPAMPPSAMMASLSPSSVST